MPSKTIGYSITTEEGKKRYGTTSSLCHSVLQRFVATSNKCLRSKLVLFIYITFTSSFNLSSYIYVSLILLGKEHGGTKMRNISLNNFDLSINTLLQIERNEFLVIILYSPWYPIN